MDEQSEKKQAYNFAVSQEEYGVSITSWPDIPTEVGQVIPAGHIFISDDNLVELVEILKNRIRLKQGKRRQPPSA
jgi:hypothetical protein